MRDDDLTRARKALIDEIISSYHTTRLADVPASTHILSKPNVVVAFANLSALERGRA